MNENDLVKQITIALEYQGPTDPLEPEVRAKALAYVQAYEALSSALNEKYQAQFSAAPEEWADSEVDEAMNAYRFWWTWGN